MFFVFFLMVEVFVITNCDLKDSSTELEQTINLIKKRLAIHSLQCHFTNMTERYYSSPVPSSVKEGQFAMRNDDLFLMVPTTFSITHIRRVKKDKTKLNLRKLLIGYKGYEEIESKVDGFLGFYRYNGISSTRSFSPEVSFREDEFKVIEGTLKIGSWSSSSIPPIIGDPRWLIGFLGMDLESPDENMAKRKLIESLDKEGKFYLYHKGNYRILWHECHYEDLSEPSGEEPLSFEVWIDENENIVKIVEGEFPTRSLGIQTVREIYDRYNIPATIDCDYPYYIFRIFEFSDFKEFNDGVRIPLKGIITRYDYKTNEEYTEMLNEAYNKYERNEISIKELITLLAICTNKEKRKEIEIQIHPETLKVNLSIPDDVFLAPEPTEEGDNVHKENNPRVEPWYIRYKTITLITSFVVITGIGIFITKRYLNWGI